MIFEFYRLFSVFFQDEKPSIKDVVEETKTDGRENRNSGTLPKIFSSIIIYPAIKMIMLLLAKEKKQIQTNIFGNKNAFDVWS
jgi:hypothetical protein